MHHQKAEWKREMLRLKVMEWRKKGWKFITAGCECVFTCRWDGLVSCGDSRQSVPKRPSSSAALCFCPLAVLFGFSFICISSVNQRSARLLSHTIRLSVSAVDVVLFPTFFPRGGCDWLTHFLAENRNNNNRIPSISCHRFCFVWSCESPAHRRVNMQRQTTDIHTDKHCRAASGLRVHVFGLWEEAGGPDTGRTCKCHTRFPGPGN